MAPLDILRYIKKFHYEFWKKSDLSAKTLNRALGLDLSDKDVSDVLTKTKDSHKTHLVVRALLDPRKAATLEALLGLNGILTLRDISSVDEAIRSRQQSDRGEREGHGAVRIWPDGAEDHYDPKGNEIEAEVALTDAIHAHGVPLVHWHAEPWSGASLVAQGLLRNGPRGRRFARMAMLHAASTNRPFEAELRTLAARLGVSTANGLLPAELVQALHERNMILVLCNSCYIPEELRPDKPKSLVRQVIRQAILQGSKDEPARLMTIGRSAEMRSLCARLTEGRSESVSAHLNATLRVDPGARNALFQYHIHRYLEWRGAASDAIGGSRLKRAHWHYEAISERAGRDVWPGAIRLRAWFASNLDNFAFFDPTAGFQRLGGPDTPPPDMVLLRNDIMGFLRRLSNTGGQGEGPSRELKALRYCSTAKHWLTEDALHRLNAPKPKNSEEVPVVRSLKKEQMIEISAEEGRYPSADDANFSGILRINRNRGLDGAGIEGKPGDDFVFVTSLGIRALAQDEWRHSAPDERALSHWRIAERLWSNQNDKDLLRAEFPYEPHYGRKRIYFLGETLRHLVRSCETVSPPDPQGSLAAPPAAVPPFPDMPTVERKGCDPRQVIDFCFDRLFLKELNGTDLRRARIGKRNLSKRHGAFEYAAELLQLLSRDQKLGSPHLALSAHLRPAFIRECGYALLDLGELKRAQSCFQRLLPGDGESPTDRMKKRIDQALAVLEGLRESADGEDAKRLWRLRASLRLARRLSRPLRRPESSGGERKGQHIWADLVPKRGLREVLNTAEREAGLLRRHVGRVGTASLHVLIQEAREEVELLDINPQDVVSLQDEIEGRLDLAMVLTERSSVDAAHGQINAAVNMIASAGIDLPERRHLGRRLLSRRAHLAYIEQDFEICARILEELESGELEDRIAAAETRIAKIRNDGGAEARNLVRQYLHWSLDTLEDVLHLAERDGDLQDKAREERAIAEHGVHADETEDFEARLSEEIKSAADAGDFARVSRLAEQAKAWRENGAADPPAGGTMPTQPVRPGRLRAHDSELQHLRIALMASEDEAAQMALSHTDPQNQGAAARLREALGKAIASAFSASSAGLQHDATGFKIVTAHALRRVGDLASAENVLDQVYSDVLAHGCSERTYLHLLREGGRLLSVSGRPIRAYASYLRVCQERADAKGFTRYADSARRWSYKVLNNLLVLRETDNWKEMVSAALKEERAFQQWDRPRASGFSGVDPLFGRYLIDSCEHIEALAVPDGIEAALRKVEEATRPAPALRTLEQS